MAIGLKAKGTRIGPPRGPVPDVHSHGRLLTAARGLVVASVLALVVAGAWPLLSRPGTLAALLGTFAGALVAARLAVRGLVPAILFFSYISYGLVYLVAGTVMAAMPYWLAAFAGLALGGAPWTRWQAAPSWRVPLAWWACTVAVLWPLAVLRASNGGPVWPISADSGVIVAPALTQLVLALWMDRLLAPQDAVDSSVARWPRVTRAQIVPALAASAALSAAVALAQHWWDRSWLSNEPWISLQRSVGMMGDANPLGVACALWAPVVLWRYTERDWRGAAAAGITALLWMAAWVSGARTTIILVAAGVAGLGIAWLLDRGRSVKHAAAAAVGALLLLMVAAAAARPLVGESSPVARLVAAVPKTSVSAVVYEMAWHRNGYGPAAVEAIREHPLLGVGIGRFTPLSTGYYQRLTGDLIPADNAPNFWRHTLAEQGLAGLLPILWQMFPGHPNLLPAFFEGEGGDLSGPIVSKPLFSREGASIVISDGGRLIEASSRTDYDAQPRIVRT